MSSALARARSGFRHRIQEITLSPNLSKHSIELELLIDNEPVYGLPVVEAGSSLHWNMDSYPCDVRRDSKIKLKITEKHFPSLRNRIGYSEYLVSDVADKLSIDLKVGEPTPQSMGFGSTAKHWDHGGPFAISITFPDWSKVKDAYMVALGKADMMADSEKGPLEGLGKYRDVLKTLIDVGKKVAGVYPAAEVVVERCAAVWEHLEKVQQLHDDMRKLLDGIEKMLPFIDFLKEHATENLLTDTITALLNLIEDSSNFMIAYLSKNAAVRLLRSAFDDSAPGRVGGLLQEFTELKEDFDRSVRVQLLGSVLTTAQRTQIDRLNPAAHSHYANTQPCQDGTRQQILGDINHWLDDQNTSEKLLWLYGHAGLGKSSIAASICKTLDSKGTLGAHFFCKRDDPDLRSPDRILSTIVHRLAIKYKAYGHAVSSAIASNAELPNSPLQIRYSNLVEQPLKALASSHKKSPGLLVVVVDALDECDKGDGRRSFLAYLRSLSALLPHIKVIVTSRPDPDIKDVFGRPNDPVVCARNAHDYDASDDIYLYTRTRMTKIATNRKRKDWPDDTIRLLSQRADGLFIWAATACRFISDAVNVDERLKQVMEGNPSGTSRLDVLYTTAIRQSMDSDDEDNFNYTRQCIAAIVATTSRTPLSVNGLEALLCSKFGAGTLRYVVDHLGSVLYEDEKKGNAVRVYHPSFADYITNPARSKEIYVEADSINTILADCCLTTMLRGLRFNICALETSHLLNRNIPDLESRVKSAIGEHLEYSCAHWTTHLTTAPNGALKAQLGEFLLGPVLLFWIEALSLLSRLNVALSSLKNVADRVSIALESYATCAYDAYRFVLAFYDAISESTPHLYISALPLAPKKSMIAERMWPLFPYKSNVTGDADDHWPACMRTISPRATPPSVTVSPDGRLIATSCEDTVQLWDAETGGAASGPLECSRGGLAFSGDGRLLFCRRNEGGIQVWDVETFEPVPMALPSASHRCSKIALSCHNRLAVTGPTQNTITVWDLCSSTTVFELVGHSRPIRSIAFSPNGRLIASGSQDKTVRVWDAHTGAALFDPLTGHIWSVSCVAFSPDSRYIVSCSLDRAVHIWDTSAGTSTMVLTVTGNGHPESVSYSPSGGSVVIGTSDHNVMLWDLNVASASPTYLLGHTNTVHSVHFSPCDRRVISGSYDCTIRIWDVGSRTAARELGAGHLGTVNHVVFSPEGYHVLSASDDKAVCTWDVKTGSAVRDLVVGPSGSRGCLAISPNCQHIVSAHEDGTLHTWDASSGFGSSKSLSDTSCFNFTTAFSSDGLRLVSICSEDNTLHVHDVDTGVGLLGPLVGHWDRITCVAFSHCSRFIVSGSLDGTVRVWSAETGVAVGEPLKYDDQVYSVAFSPDGHFIASGLYGGVIQVWDFEKGTLIHESLNGHKTPVSCVLFSPNGRHVVSGSWDRTLRIWNMELDIPTSELLVGHTGPVTSVAFSPDGGLFASGSGDSTVRIWDPKKNRAAMNLSLTHLITALYPSINPSSNLTRSVSQIDTKPQLLDLTLPTSYLAHRLLEGGWVSLAEGSVLVWLPPDYRVIDDSIIQISAKPVHRYSIDFSHFVHGDRWSSIASDSICRYNLAA